MRQTCSTEGFVDSDEQVKVKSLTSTLNSSRQLWRKPAAAMLASQAGRCLLVRSHAQVWVAHWHGEATSDCARCAALLVLCFCAVAGMLSLQRLFAP